MHLIIARGKTLCHWWWKMNNTNTTQHNTKVKSEGARRKTCTSIRQVDVMQILPEWRSGSNPDRDASPLPPLQWQASAHQTKTLAKRRKWHRFYFQPKIPHWPPTHCLRLSAVSVSMLPSPSPCWLSVLNFSVRRPSVHVSALCFCTGWTGPVGSWTGPSRHGKQREVRG